MNFSQNQNRTSIKRKYKDKPSFNPNSGEIQTFTRSSLSDSRESKVPTRRSGALNCGIELHHTKVEKKKDGSNRNRASWRTRGEQLTLYSGVSNAFLEMASCSRAHCTDCEVWTGRETTQYLDVGAIRLRDLPNRTKPTGSRSLLSSPLPPDTATALIGSRMFFPRIGFPPPPLRSSYGLTANEESSHIMAQLFSTPFYGVIFINNLKKKKILFCPPLNIPSNFPCFSYPFISHNFPPYYQIGLISPISLSCPSISLSPLTSRDIRRPLSYFRKYILRVNNLSMQNKLPRLLTTMNNRKYPMVLNL